MDTEVWNFLWKMCCSQINTNGPLKIKGPEYVDICHDVSYVLRQ